MKRYGDCLWLLLAVALVLGCSNGPPDVVDINDPPGQTGGDDDGGDEKGVILLRYNPGSESTHQREEGFLETMRSDYPDVNFLVTDEYAGTTAESSLDKAQNLVNKYGDRTEGLFAVCESNANGALGALTEAKMTDDVAFVGFDPNERMVNALREGKMQGIVLQDPVTMAYKAVNTLVLHLDPDAEVKQKESYYENGKLRKRIATGEYVATADNIDDEKINRLLHPPQQEEAAEPPADVRFRIAVIPKGTSHEFWKSVHYGAVQAAAEQGDVEILYKGPAQEHDSSSQISLVQDFITKGVDGIVVAPNDSQALVDAIREAKENGVPVVIFDSGLNDADAYVSYVATDNYNGGALAAHRMAEVLGHKKANNEP